jgi:PAS domain S-box-containing protein
VADEKLNDAPAPLLEESAEELYEHAPCGYLSTLPDGLVVKVNQTFLGWTGYDREALVGRRRFQSLLGIGGQMYWETHLAPLLQMQGFVNQIAFDLVCADGKKLAVLANSVRRSAPDGRPLGHRMTLIDASERREYERELLRARQRAEDATEAKATFLSMVSHEIRAPLNAILGVAHLLGRTSATPQQERYIRILRSSSEGLLALINDVLDFSKIEAGKVVLAKQPFAVRALADEIVVGFAAQADEKRLALTADVDERVPAMVVGDPIKLGQVLRNLVGNALKFTAGGEVRLSVVLAASEPGAVTLAFAVSDTGIGIPADRLAHIFEEYAQATPEIGRRYGGTGLGLGISRRIVELHQSKLHVTSAPGQGSTFSFEVTLPIAPAPVADEPRPDPRAPLVRGLRLLIADPDAAGAQRVAGWLRHFSISVDLVADGRQALERVLERDYDVVLLELELPSLSGEDAARTIRRMPGARLGALPILALSGAAPPSPARLEAAGFNDFVGKPYDADALLTTIASLARREAVATQRARRVLIVDDDADAAELLAESLQLAGYAIRIASDPAGAVAATRDFSPEVALLDVELGGTTGYDVARALRSVATPRPVHFVALTGHGGDADRARSQAAGFDAHVMKPVRIDTLVALLKQLE